MTVPLGFELLLREQVRRIVAAGFDLTLVCAPGEEMIGLASDVGARFCPIPMTRRFSPFSDVRAILALTRLFKRERFDLVHSSTPKAGLVTAIAGVLAGVPFRLHTFTGQPWVEFTGAKRVAALNADRAVARLDSHLYVDSSSQRDFLVANRIAPADRLHMLGAGSLSGVDLRRYDPIALAPERDAVRRQLGIAPDAHVIVFLGRQTRDKGMGELVAAFGILAATRPDVALILVGPNDADGGPIGAEVRAAIDGSPRIHVTGFVPRPEIFLAAADILCLPSYRESFGLAIIEAGALGLPVVATRVVGIVDSVVEDQTGVLVPPKDIPALAAALAALIDDPARRRRLGEAGHARARSLFDADLVNGAVIAEYRRLLEPR